MAQLGAGILTIGATAKSIKGTEGGTHLRNVILSLQSLTYKAVASMNELDVSVYDSQGNMQSLSDILGD